MALKKISVEVKNLSKHFGRFVAVNNISFEVYQGEIFGFLGANGAGKTTTIRMLCGLMLPTDGEAYINGLSITTQSEQIKQQIGYMSQKFSLYHDITVEDNITFYGGIYGLSSKTLNERKREILSQLGLNSQRKMKTSALPLGWKQRLALGCSMLHCPPFLFLDEPTSGIDPISRREFWKLINELAQQNTTIFVTTHYMDEAEYCNRLSIMHQGKIVTINNPQALKSQYQKPTIEDVFITLVDK